MIKNTLEQSIQHFYEQIEGYSFQESLIVIYTEMKLISESVRINAHELHQPRMGFDDAPTLVQYIDIAMDYLQFLSHYIIAAREAVHE